MPHVNFFFIFLSPRLIPACGIMCMLCDLSIRPSCSNNPASYGSPSIGLCGLLFVLGGLFALDGGGASAHSGYPLALRALWTCASSDFLSSTVVTY